MKKLFIVSIFLSFFGLQNLFSQELVIGITPYQLITAGNHFDSGSGGTAFEIVYRHNFKPNFKWYAGLEAGTALWGTELLADAGFVYFQPISGVWSWEATAGLQQGVALFKPTSLYTGGLTSTIGIQAKLSEKSTLAFNTGLRYVFCPGYAQYSSVAGSLQIPLNLSYRIAL